VFRRLSLVTAGNQETATEEESELQLDPVVESDLGDDGDTPPTPRRSGAPALKVSVVLLAIPIALCAAVIFSYLFATVFSGLEEQRDQHQLYAQFRGLLDPSSTVAPKIGGVISPGFPVALMNSKQAHIHDLVVVEGTSSSDLLAGPGHLSDTPLPGQSGNSVVMGKSTTAGAPFRHLRNLKRGDTIDVSGQFSLHGGRYPNWWDQAGDAQISERAYPGNGKCRLFAGTVQLGQSRLRRCDPQRDARGGPSASTSDGGEFRGTRE
jgi:hypothetical protein